MDYMENLTEYVEKQASLCQQHDVIDKELYARYGVKRGLRDEKFSAGSRDSHRRGILQF